jgi:hypothetical protein
VLTRNQKRTKRKKREANEWNEYCVVSEEEFERHPILGGVSEVGVEMVGMVGLL